jgi:hypothetical protein
VNLKASLTLIHVMVSVLLVILMLILDDFVLELDLVVCDLSFARSVDYTYERDDGSCSFVD